MRCLSNEEEGRTRGTPPSRPTVSAFTIVLQYIRNFERGGGKNIEPLADRFFFPSFCCFLWCFLLLFLMLRRRRGTHARIPPDIAFPPSLPLPHEKSFVAMACLFCGWPRVRRRNASRDFREGRVGVTRGGGGQARSVNQMSDGFNL